MPFDISWNNFRCIDNSKCHCNHGPNNPIIKFVFINHKICITLGKVDEAVMLMDQQTKRHRGFGFVTFENEETVDRVCEIHFHTIKNKKV